MGTLPSTTPAQEVLPVDLPCHQFTNSTSTASLHNYKQGVVLQFIVTTGRVYTITSREWCYSSPAPQAAVTQLQAGSGATVHCHHRQSLHNYKQGVVPSLQAELTQLQAGSGAIAKHGLPYVKL